VIGDSFIEAQAVDVGRTAPELLHAGLRGSGRVYSIGVSGAPLSQYLVYAQYASRTFRPDAMAFAIISNDFDESLMKYKSEPRFHYFDEKGGEVTLRRVDYALSPAKQVLRHSAFLRYVMYNAAAEQRIQALLNSTAPAAWASRDAEPPEALDRRVRDSERAVDYFFDRLPAMSGLDSRAIVFVLDAVRPAIYEEDSLKNSETTYHARMRRYFAAAARERGYAILDMQPVFIARHRQDGKRFEFPTDSHWNELGHRLIAEELRGSSVFKQLFPRGAPEGLGPQADARGEKL
jgi:SGNH hydrolase-like domain, acetyltransferase AlgX